MAHHKKFLVILLILIIGSGYIFYRQIKESKKIVTQYVPASIVSADAVNIPVNPTDPSLGNPGAETWIVLFADLGCKRCQETFYAATKFASNNPEKIRLIWKDAPQSSFFSTGNWNAHLATYCANEQGQFWKFASLVMQDKYNLKEAGLQKVAQGLNLDLNKWNTCRTATSTQTKIAESVVTAKILGVTTLPGLFVNNKQVKLTNDIDIADLLNKLSTKVE